MTGQDYVNACRARGTDGAQFENQALSIGREFLPACAIAVLDGDHAQPSGEYWAWLISQLGEVSNGTGESLEEPCCGEFGTGSGQHGDECEHAEDGLARIAREDSEREDACTECQLLGCTRGSMCGLQQSERR